MKVKRTASYDDTDLARMLRAAQGLDPYEFLEIMYGVAEEMAAEGVPSVEIDAACVRICEWLGFDPKRFMN